jgi:hypothetical protein
MVSVRAAVRATAAIDFGKDDPASISDDRVKALLRCIPFTLEETAVYPYPVMRRRRL